MGSCFSKQAEAQGQAGTASQEAKLSAVSAVTGVTAGATSAQPPRPEGQGQASSTADDAGPGDDVRSHGKAGGGADQTGASHLPAISLVGAPHSAPAPAQSSPGTGPAPGPTPVPGPTREPVQSPPSGTPPHAGPPSPLPPQTPSTSADLHSDQVKLDIRSAPKETDMLASSTCVRKSSPSLSAPTAAPTAVPEKIASGGALFKRNSIDTQNVLAGMALDPNVAAMRALGAKDGPSDPEIGSVLKLITNVFQVPVVLVSLFQDQRIYIKQGSSAIFQGDLPWRAALSACCSKTESTITVIEDTTKDARFDGYPGVATSSSPDADGLLMHSFVGMPLMSGDGKYHLGMICLGDVKPRKVEMAQTMLLGNLSKMIVRNVEKDIELQLKQQDNKALNAAFTHLKQTMDCIDSCMVLIDTAVPGFMMTYTNSAWKKVTGLNPSVAVGHCLNTLMESGTGQLVPTAEHQELANRGEEFMVQEARLQSRSKTEKSGRRFTLKFRPTSIVDADEKDAAKGALSNHYFMTIALYDPRKPRSGGTGSSSTADASGIIEGLEVGRLLGKGAFGSVYSGLWFGTPVAVKVIDQDMRSLAATGGANMEAVMGAELRHPHIACTLTYVVRYPPGAGSGSLSGHGGGKGARASSGTGFFPPSSLSKSPVFGSGLSPSSSLNSESELGLNPGLGSGQKDESGRVSAALELMNASAYMPTMGSKRKSSSFHASPGSNSRSAGFPLRAIDEAQPQGDIDAPGSAAGTEEGEGEEEEMHRVVCEPPTSATCSLSSSGVVPEENQWAVIDFSQGIDQLDEMSSSDEERGSSRASPRMPGLLKIGDPLSSSSFSKIRDAMPNSTNGVGLISAAEVGAMISATQRSSIPSIPSIVMTPTTPRTTAPLSGPSLISGWEISAEHDPHARKDWENDAPVQQAQTIIVMEFCDKGCLQDAIDEGALRTSSTGKVYMLALLATAYEMAGALHYLHTSANIIHGDLSAYNVLLAKATPTPETGNRSFKVKIADFGLARILDIKTRIQTRTYGTITHMPPETLLDGVISKAVDVYSYGVLLWQMYTGARPFHGLQHSQIIMAVVSKKNMLSLPLSAPAELSSLINMCLAHDPNDRPTFQEVMLKVKAMLDDEY